MVMTAITTSMVIVADDHEYWNMYFNLPFRNSFLDRYGCIILILLRFT